jgi:signal transduction histidine kinase
MNDLLDFLLNFISQFAGGPGPPENNLVRFGLAAILWGILLATAWNRARRESHIRERLLLAGFGLALFRELFKLGNLLYKMLTGIEHGPLCAVLVPAEHALTLASVVLITGAYLRYILDDALLARRFLVSGLSVVTLATAASAIWWPRYILAVGDAHFHDTWLASTIHLVGAIIVVPAIGIMIRRRGWLGNVVASALFLLFISEIAVFINYVTDRAFAEWLCPVGNAIYLLAIPLFAYVYYHEQQNEQLRAEAALRTYRDHLEDLVQERTSEITRANDQLQEEIGERRRAQADLVRRNAELAAQNAIAATISHSLDLETILEATLERTLVLTGMQHGSIFLLDPESGKLVLRIRRGHPAGNSTNADGSSALHTAVSEQAVSSARTVVRAAGDRSTTDAAGEFAMATLDTVVSVPLISQDHAVGTLTLSTGTAGAHGLSPAVLEWLTGIGQQVGVAVEKAQLQQQLEMAAALEERQRIAAEMHDGLAQTLSYMGLKTDRAAELLETGQGEQAAEIFHQIRDAIGQATVEVRRSIASLQESPAPRLSLQEAVSRVIDAAQVDGLQGVVMENALPAPVIFAAAEQEQIVRVVQEALNNALHHSAAQTIRVRMEAGAGNIVITIEDNGRGFSTGAQDLSNGEHFGLSIMRARAERLGGELQIHSEVGAGTRVALVVPWPNKLPQAMHFILSDEPVSLPAALSDADKSGGCVQVD